jgi:phosphate-selective porin OprO/OprP
MKKPNTWIVAALILIAVFALQTGKVFAKEEKRKSVNEKILEILIEKQIITKEQYEELVRQVREEEEEVNQPKVMAGFNKGFYIETADKKSKIKFDGRFHGDFKTYLGDHPDHASFFVRRARLCASGTFYKHYDFRVEGEFGKGDSRLNDGFMNIHYWPFAQLKFGQFKAPFSMEELRSDNWIDFIERSLPNKLSPSRDIGMMIHGGIKDELVYYELGLFNGYKLNRVSDPDGGKDLALRLVVSPFKKSGIKPIEGLHIGGAMTHGNVHLTEDQWWNSGDLKTAAGTTYLGMSKGVVHNGDRTRSGFELSWDWGPTTLKAEYIVTKFDGLKLGNLSNDFDIKGGYIYLSYFLTGEKFVYKKGRPGRVVPLKRFSPGDNGSGWGALQLAARFEYLKADEGLLDLGYADATKYTDRASGFTIGINWYPNEMVRFMLNYYHMEFDDPVMVSSEQIGDEDVILTRLQAVF